MQSTNSFGHHHQNGIVVEPLSDGVRIALPQHRAMVRVVGTLAMALVVAIPAFVFSMMSPAMAAIGIVMGLGAVVPGLVVGSFLVFGHTDIEIRGDRLRVTRRLGGFSRSEQRQRSRLGGIGFRRPGRHRKTGQVFLGLVRLDFHGGKSMVFGSCYDADVLEMAAELIRAHCGVEGLRTEVLTVEARSLDSSNTVVPARPEKTQVTIERNERGLLLQIPALGLFKGVPGLALFAVVWFAATNFVGVVISNKEGIGVLLVTTPVSLIGVALFLIAWNIGKRRAVVAVIGDTLLIHRFNLFGKRSHEWRRGDLESIEVTHSGMEVNKRPVLCLQVKTRHGEEHKLWAGRATDELEWIAGELRNALVGAQRGAAAGENAESGAASAEVSAGVPGR